MESYSATNILAIFKHKNISYFTADDFGRLLNIKNQNTIYKKLQRLQKNGIIKKLINGKYLFTWGEYDDFTTANFLYQPSYISFESALSFYSIITGFSYRITSAAPKKTKLYTIDQKEYIYTHIKKQLFWGYIKKDSFLMAEKEKALLDYLYLFSKGLKSFDAQEFDLSQIDKKRLKHYALKFKSKKILSLINKIT